MKSSILVTVIMTLSLTTGGAQDFKIGAKAGVNLASLGGGFEGGKTRTSLHLGGMVEIPVIDQLSLQPELLYSGQGAGSDFFESDVFKLDYITLPVMAKYHVIDALSIEAGPQVGFLLNAKWTIAGDTEDVKDISKTIDIGLNLGLGYKMENGINFGARYYFGSNVPEGSSLKFKNNVFQISAGYFFY